jgi:mannose-1-phosphate guanylyltransferase
MIEWLAGHGVEDVVLACGFLPDVLREALGDGERTGARVSYVAEPRPLGTGGAIRYAADQLGDQLGERFLALNGDVLTDLDLTALLQAHERRQASLSIGLHPVRDAASYGLVRLGEGDEVLAFEEKTGRHDPGQINAGMYVLERSVLDLIPAGETVSIEHDVFPRLVGDGLHGLPLEGYWMDIGTPERYLQASWDILEGAVETRVEPTGPGMYVDPAAEVAESATLGPRLVVGPGCRIASGVEARESVLLERCAIEMGASLSGSILSAEVQVAAGASVEDAVLGRGARVG